MEIKDIKQEKPVDPKVKDILKLLGTGVFLGASFMIPGVPILAAPYINAQRKKDANEWKKYNKWRLKQVLKRLHQQKMVEVTFNGGEQIVKLTEKGQRRLLHYNLKNMTLNKKNWDGKWRLIIYDIFSPKKSERYIFHKMLKNLEFLQIQRSVYLTPYYCKDEIEYLRQIFSIGAEVYILVVTGIENEKIYKEYFGLNPSHF